MKSIFRSLASGLVGAFLLSGGVLAEGAHSDFHGPAGADLSWVEQTGDTSAGGGPAMRQLSPGNRQVAESLYRAQLGQPRSRSLEQIAAAKVAGASWNEIFHQIKSQGLLRESTLGQVISTFNRTRNSEPADRADRRQPRQDRQFARAGDMREPAIEDHPAQHRAGPGGRTSVPAFEQLSPGNQKIAMTLFAAQRRGSGIRSLEEIASAKSNGTRWSAIFNALKADGLVAEQNLGQVINRHASGDGRIGPPVADHEIVVRSPARLYADARILALRRERAAALAPKSRVKPVTRAPITELAQVPATSVPAVAAPVGGKRTAGKGPGTRYLPSLRPDAQVAHRSGATHLASWRDGGTAKQQGLKRSDRHFWPRLLSALRSRTARLRLQRRGGAGSIPPS